ncbi:hypothetical protein ACQ86F_24615 [Streptomyces venezuelae ATCC 10712]
MLFLDSDDLLLPGAVDGLLAVATARDADVVAGICVRRELPEGRETVWAPSLYDVSQGATLPGTVLDGVEGHPEFVLDTLSVNKLYRRDFLDRHAIRFPDGAFHYEDFVFSARVQAATPGSPSPTSPCTCGTSGGRPRPCRSRCAAPRRPTGSTGSPRTPRSSRCSARRGGPRSPAPPRRSSSTTTSPCTCASCRSGPPTTGPAGGRRPART